MPYKYIAYTVNNTVVEGAISAASEAAAEEALLKAGYRPIVLRRMRRSINLAQVLPSVFGVKLKDVITLAHQLGMLLRSGIPLVTALDALRSQYTNPEMRNTLGAIIQDVRGGTPLSTALRAFPQVFPTLYTRMVAVGERAGDLEGLLEQVAAYYNREMALKKRVQHALFYPAIVVLMTVVVGFVMITIVLPQVMLLAATLAVELPLITRLLLSSSQLLTEFKLHLIALAAAAAVGLRMALRHPRGRLRFHTAILRVPLVGKIIVYRELARLSRTMGLLLTSGLPLPEILELVGQLVGNEAIRDVVREVRQEVMIGRPMAGPLGRASFMPSIFTQMVRTGELTGSLDANLGIMATLYDQDLEELLQTAVSLIEPIMTLAIGGLVGLMALSVIMPIYTIVGKMGGG